MQKHLIHFFKATTYTLKGLKITFKKEIAFRQEVFILVLMLVITYFLDIILWQKVLLIASWLLVMAVELINSGIESLANRLDKKHNDLIGDAKDQGSAAVGVVILISVIVWFGILL